MTLRHTIRRERGLRILQVVIKNTSELDFSAPLLWSLAQEPGVEEIGVLYCNISRKQFLRDSCFYPDLFAGSGVREYDFADFLRPGTQKLAPALRRSASMSPSDRPSIRGALHGLRAAGLQGLIGAEGRRRARHLIRGNVQNLMAPLAMRLVDVGAMLEHLDPDLILLGNRSVTDFHGRERFYEYYDEVRRPVVLLPHGTHEVHPSKEFIPFDERGQAMAEYCEFWSAFREEPWQNLPEQRDQFANTGYPGMDSAWLRHLREASGTPEEDAPLRCLVILRKFLPEGYSRPENFDPFTLDYETMLGHLDLIGESLARAGEPVEVVIKPHPSNNFPLLEEILNRSSIEHWTISHEPMYPLLPRVHFAISIFSTVLLLPVMYGIPVVLLNSDLQEYVHDRWDVLREMYGGLRYFLSDPQDLRSAIADVVAEARRVREQGADPSGPDAVHLRTYYPDGAIETAIRRLGALAGETPTSLEERTRH